MILENYKKSPGVLKEDEYIVYFNYQLLGITKGELMTDWKPKNLDEALGDIIGSALNDNITCQDLGGGDTGPEHINPGNFDTVVKQAIVDIMQSDYINIKFKE